MMAEPFPMMPVMEAHNNSSSSPMRSPSPMVHGMLPPSECPCPTCLYYKAYYMYGTECISPNVDMFAMYAPLQPQQPMMMPVMYPSFSRARSVSVDVNVDEQFKDVIGTIAQVACTANGRALLQAAMRSQDPNHLHTIFTEVLVAVDAVALDVHGCHVLRSLVEVLEESQLVALIAAMNETLVLNMCTLSQYTRRVLQALFERHPNIDLQSVVDKLGKNVQYLAATQQGCISLMRIFEQCNPMQKAQLMTPLLPMFAEFSFDPFGNYVVQCAVEHSDKPTAAKYVLDCFSGNFLKMSCNKFASNVVEKIVTCANVPVVRRVMLDELVFNPAALQQLVHDGYGNFVVQALIESSTNANDFKKICDRLRPAMAGSPYAHKIDAKIRSKKQFQHPNHRLADVSNQQRNAVPAAC